MSPGKYILAIRIERGSIGFIFLYWILGATPAVSWLSVLGVSRVFRRLYSAGHQTRALTSNDCAPTFVPSPWRQEIFISDSEIWVRDTLQNEESLGVIITHPIVMKCL